MSKIDPAQVELGIDFSHRENVDDMEIEDVFEIGHCHPCGCYSFFFFLLWPILSIIIFPLRLIILTIGFLIAMCCPGCSPTLFRYFIFPACGIFVRVCGRDNILMAQEPTILTCNHYGNLDPLWFSTAFISKFSLVAEGSYEHFWVLLMNLGLLLNCIYTKTQRPLSERKKVRSEIMQWSREGEHPLLIFPEGVVTGSSVAVLRYEKFVFSIKNANIVPCAMKVWYPWPLRYYVFGSDVIANVLQYIWTPFVVITIHVMKPEKKLPEETSGEFARRIQVQTAEKLGIAATKYLCWKDKCRLLEALHLDELHERTWKGSDMTPEIYRKVLSDRGGVDIIKNETGLRRNAFGQNNLKKVKMKATTKTKNDLEMIKDRMLKNGTARNRAIQDALKFHADSNEHLRGYEDPVANPDQFDDEYY